MKRRHAMNRFVRRAGVSVLTGLLFCILSCTAVWAQDLTTAQISGTVKDQSGAVLPGVAVNASQTATGAKRSSITDENGFYTLPNLPIGPYMFEATLPGFSTYVQTGIVLQVGSDPSINVVLRVGQVSDQIEVQADAALIETRNTGVGTVLDNQRVLEMPLNGRQVTELIFLAGMATQGTGQSASLQSLRNYPTVSISITGGIPNWVTYSLDGANNNDPYMGLNLPVPFPDALQEFKVETSALPAQYGQHASAAVNAVTKAGTNQFHGDLFEFLRNGRLNARNFFAPQRDNLKRNQYGGTVGGPVLKDKLFFFLGYQGTPQRSSVNSNIAYVPTADMLAGDFRAAASPSCAGRQITLPAAQGFANNQISPSRLSVPALNISKKLPLSTDPCGKVIFGRINNQDESQGVIRVDYQKSDKHSMFGRFFVANLDAPSTYDGKSLLTIFVNGLHDRVYTLAVGDTYVFGAGLVSSLRFGATRSVLPKTVDNVGSWKDFGVNASSPLGNLASLTVTGNGFTSSSGNAIYNIANTGPNPFLSEDLSVVRGTHQFGTGAQYQYQQMTYKSGVNGHGVFTFNGSATGLSMADFLTGNATTWKQGNANIFYDRQHYFGLYFQDSWKVTSRLTVNYGVRWEPYLAIFSKRGEFAHFEPTLFEQNVHSTRYVNAPAGVVYPGDAQYVPGKSISSNRWTGFEPRLGMAWDPTGSGRTTIRAAFGTFTDKQTMNAMSPMAQGQPFGALVLLNNVNLSDPWANYPGGNPIPLAVNKDTVFPTAGAYLTYPFKWIPTTINQWNLSFQRQIRNDWLVTANYVGNNITHLLVGSELNSAVFLGTGPCSINGTNYATCSTTGNINQRRRLSLANPGQGQYFSVLSEASNGGTGNYNALYLAVQKRLSGGVSILANHTWSHCISDYWVYSFPTGTSNTTPGNRRNDRSNCEGRDQRHVFNLSAVAQTPQYQSRAMRLLASDWQVSPIVRLKSASFFTVFTGVDNALNGEGEQRPVLVNTNPYPSNQSVDQWINASAFASPAPGTISGLGRNNFKGPGTVQFDIGISRLFRVREKQTFQFRVEAFNVMNHANFNIPVATTNGGAFGKIQSAGDPRIIQFALKYLF